MTLYMIFHIPSNLFCSRRGTPVSLSSKDLICKPYIWSSSGPAKSAIWRFVGGKPRTSADIKDREIKNKKHEEYAIVEVHLDDLLDSTLWKKRLKPAWSRIQ